MITRECRYCVGFFPDGDYEVNDANQCIACLDTRIEQVTECDGCGETHPLKRYVVEYHDGGSDDEVYYCDDCADLAKMDWNGETKSIELKVTP